MPHKKKLELDDDATMNFAIRFILGIAATIALAITAAIVVGVVALIRWVF